MAKILTTEELGAGRVLMLEEIKDEQLWLRPEAVQGNDGVMVDMWHTIKGVEEYGKTWRAWDSVPTMVEQVEAVWAGQ